MQIWKTLNNAVDMRPSQPEGHENWFLISWKLCSDEQYYKIVQCAKITQVQNNPRLLSYKLHFHFEITFSTSYPGKYGKPQYITPQAHPHFFYAPSEELCTSSDNLIPNKHFLGTSSVGRILRDQRKVMHSVGLYLFKSIYFIWEKDTIDIRNNKEFNTVEDSVITYFHIGLVGVEWGTALSRRVDEEGFMLEMCLQ